MAILGEKGLSGIVKRLLDLVFIGGIGIYAGIPIVLKWYMEFIYSRSSESYPFLMVFLYVTGVPCLWAVYEVRKIFKTLNRMNPFMADNVKSLNHLSVTCFIIAVAYVVKIIYYPSFLTVIVAMLAVIGGLFLVVLAEVFHQAVKVKEENDLTV
ncbi:DUF2975 family protein [Anaerobacterium chartisolvens]|uniref:DUF2975 family protein n=1 Tax=Anaerobacterium chartisolvens TaxID=1297424 RepID=A0A369BAC7_9FIRM|nr:DUF2975 domain-containing protein [Anaerobacterium chartisolvens]RCX17477.1 DUF2975 family protein [Anaerobacterium chartisolvens]